MDRMGDGPILSVIHCMHSIVPQEFWPGYEIAFVLTSWAMIFGTKWWKGAIEGTIEYMHWHNPK